MNAGDLKKIKDDLLVIQNQYVPVSQISKDGIMNAGAPMPSGDVNTLALQSTYEVVKQCESLIQKTVKTLTEKEIPFDQLVISSNMGVLCRLDYFNELKEYYQESDGTNEKLETLMKTLHIKTYPKIVPVSFSVNTIFTGTEDCNMDSFANKNGLSDNDLSLKTVSGIVNWDKFVSEIDLLGYNIEFLNYKKGLSEFDYIMAVKQNGSNAQINITADLGRIKKIRCRRCSFTR